jgi:hypothetical protein
MKEDSERSILMKVVVWIRVCGDSGVGREEESQKLQVGGKRRKATKRGRMRRTGFWDADRWEKRCLTDGGIRSERPKFLFTNAGSLAVCHIFSNSGNNGNERRDGGWKG